MIKIIESYNVISALPRILVYIIPGLIAVEFYAAATRSKISWNSKIIVSSCMSFIVVGLLRTMFKGIHVSVYGEAFVASILCFGLSFGWIKIRQEKCVKEFFIERLSFSYARDTWEDILNYQVGTHVRLKLKNRDDYVCGRITSLGDVNSNPWVGLTYYSFVDPDGEIDESGYIVPYYKQEADDKYFVFNVNEVEWMESWSGEKQ